MSFLFNPRLGVSHEINRSYVRTFLHSVGESLAEPFNLVSNVRHVEITV